MVLRGALDEFEKHIGAVLPAVSTGVVLERASQFPDQDIA